MRISMDREAAERLTELIGDLITTTISYENQDPEYANPEYVEKAARELEDFLAGK